MTTEFNWTPYVGADVDWLTGAQLNNLGIGGAALGETINNDTLSHFYADIELTLASVNLVGQTNPSVAVYLLKAIDGATFSDTRASASTLVVVIDVAATNAAHI